MSDTEIMALCEKVAQDAITRALLALGIKNQIRPWVTFNYALKLLKPHGIGRRKLDKALLRGVVTWKQVGRFIMIKRETLKNLIDYETD